MKKTIMAVSALLIFVQGWAQQGDGDLNRELDVTREYEPTVNSAVKLGIKPNMVDTASLRVDVDYEITPDPIQYRSEVTPIKPVSVSVDNLHEELPFYIKAGLGVPFQSVLDANISSIRNLNGKWGLYVNHYGSWSKRKSYDGLKTPGSQTFNTVGVFGEHRFGRFGIGGEIGFDYDKISRYGYSSSWAESVYGESATDLFDASANALRQNYSTVRGKIVFGHSFEDLSRFNIRFGAEGYYFSDRYDAKEAHVNAFLDLGKRFGIHEITLHAGYDLYQGSGLLDEYKNSMFSIRPMYRVRGGTFDIALGVTYVAVMDDFTYADEGDGQSASVLFPLFDLKWKIAKGFTPYLKLDGRQDNYGYRNTTLWNPYVLQGFVGRNTSVNDARIGIQGSSASSFSYNVYGGFSRYLNMNYAQNYYYQATDGTPVYQGNVFVLAQRDVTMWTVGGEVVGRISGKFGMELGVQYKGYRVKEVDGVKARLGLPALTARLALNYNYRDKLLLKAGADVYGPRDYEMLFTSYTHPSEVVYGHDNMQVDVHLGAEYNFSKNFGIFVEGRNLANQSLYYYNQYKALGINFLAGVKIQF